MPRSRNASRCGCAVVAAVSLNEVGFAPRTSRLAADGRDGLEQWQQLGDVVAVGLGEQDAQRNALRVGEKVVFRARFTAIKLGSVQFSPAPTARIE